MAGHFSAIDISASGLAAERLRMEVTANNIANAGTTMTAGGEPYRKQSVIFAAAIDQAAAEVHCQGATVSGRSVSKETCPSFLRSITPVIHMRMSKDLYGSPMSRFRRKWST